ncbi:hypothetical protein GCM10025771_07290 [Niveibacterium umoris]|uniref:Uncharacterized protein n=1 Tax=Niveibacterium umoris TaxID=1193620 RepID=A0A840BMI0_9RHOO|nr:hypothetical protein [Niveibacterium umoris]MBB4013724.1 hypothetical protein [Niveibacterium umoris]
MRRFMTASFIALLGLAATPVALASDCPAFVVLLAADGQTVLASLNRCEVTPAAAWPSPWQARAWALTPAAQARWHETLTHATVRGDMLAARLQLLPADPALHGGPLLLRISARLTRPADWRWDDARGQLAYLPQPARDATER